MFMLLVCLFVCLYNCVSVNSCYYNSDALTTLYETWYVLVYQHVLGAIMDVIWFHNRI
jgi:hypothetical protein